MSASPRTGWYRTTGKRLIDVVGGMTLFLALAPLLVVLGVLVRLRLGTPILFVQTRPGLNGRLFSIFKFRTMTDACDATGNLLSDEERLTPFGRWLRATSLDELPEMWNIVRGDMSFVGPRPLLADYLALYDSEQARRHAVRPGLTGWAQVNGRNSSSWDERLAQDVWYVDHVSLWLDLKIVWKTVWKVLGREGVSAPDCATMPRFTGSRSADRTASRAA